MLGLLTRCKPCHSYKKSTWRSCCCTLCNLPEGPKSYDIGVTSSQHVLFCKRWPHNGLGIDGATNSEWEWWVLNASQRTVFHFSFRHVAHNGRSGIDHRGKMTSLISRLMFMWRTSAGLVPSPMVNLPSSLPSIFPTQTNVVQWESQSNMNNCAYRIPS